MRELEHADLFKPPQGTRAIVVPCAGEYWDKPPATKYTPMTYGYAKLAKIKFKNIHIAVGILQWRVGVTPHPLTIEYTIDKKKRIKMAGKQGNLPLRYHVVTLPTRHFAGQPIEIDFLVSKLRELVSLCDDRIPWLAKGDIVLPQISDPDHGKLWSDFRRYVIDWLPERYVVISGKKDLAT